MIALFNLLIWVVLIGGLFISIKYTSWKWFLGTIVVAFLMGQFQPSYFPKGEIEREAVPEFEQSTEVIEDKLLSPKSGEQYDKEREVKIKEGLPFKSEN
jgi:hypothetical protein